VYYICHAESKTFQPANITFDLLPQLDEATRRVRDKKQRHKMVCENALESLASWLHDIAAGMTPSTGENDEPSKYLLQN
jgi:methylenetetrahydrofolate--tRNA-(uracil-5-)-methyltransferase